MNRACPTEDELIVLLDGAATEERARELRAHIARCTSCQATFSSLERLVRDLAAPIPGTPSAAALERVMKRIEALPPARVEPARPRYRWQVALTGAIGAVAAAAAVLLANPRLAPNDPPGTFVARGGAEPPSLRRNVGVTIHRGGERMRPLTAGERVDTETSYAVSYRNLGADGSAFLMVFAVDAAGAVHWIYPAYLDAKDDPSSVALDHAASDKILPTAAALETPAPGRLRLVTLVTPRSLKVSQIESIAAADLTISALRARFPDAEITETAVELQPKPPR